jgi:hypothetical protein
MNANEIIDNIKFVADKQYEGEPAAYRLAYHVGLLESHLRTQINLVETAQEYIKDLETQLIAKDSE